MIIWINGTFGSGKTTTAYELNRRLRKAIVYDPERFGFVLMQNIPSEIAKSDFQDYPLWREANVKLLKQITTEYDGTIIVPMTLTSDKYFKEIIGELREAGINVKHFTLVAAEKTIHRRLRKRMEGKRSFAYQQMKKRVHQLENPIFETHITTDGMSVDEVVESLAKSAGVGLLSDNRSRIRKVFGRYMISFKKMGIFK